MRDHRPTFFLIFLASVAIASFSWFALAVWKEDPAELNEESSHKILEGEEDAIAKSQPLPDRSAAKRRGSSPFEPRRAHERVEKIAASAGAAAQTGNTPILADQDTHPKPAIAPTKSAQPASAVIVLAPSTVARYRQTVWEDCHGEIVIACQQLIDTFTRVLKAPDFVDDGWSEWMEGQIRASLSAKAREYRSTHTDVKCDNEGCVFVLYAHGAAEVFDSGWRHTNDFDKWLREQTWNEWLVVHARQNGNSSTLAWRVVGSLNASPFINWYVVTRRE